MRGAAQDMARGSLDTVSEGVRRARAQLTGDKEFHNVDERFHKQNALVLTTRMAASDLEKYHRVRSRMFFFFFSLLLPLRIWLVLCNPLFAWQARKHCMPVPASFRGC